MSIKARIRTDSLGNITVHMEGGIEYDKVHGLKEELDQLLQDNPCSEITLDLNHLDFVGSSGIGNFVETIKELNQKGLVRLANVGVEFKKVFKLYDSNISQLIYDEFDSDDTENLNSRFIGRKKTFQN